MRKGSRPSGKIKLVGTNMDQLSHNPSLEERVNHIKAIFERSMERNRKLLNGTWSSTDDSFEINFLTPPQTEIFEPTE